MADFSPPFGSVGGVNRSPTVDEQNDGFSCGDADLTLFNRLFGRIEAEMKAIQDAGGISGTEGDDTTVLQAILALINAATGGGETSDYVLFSQAQARLPIFPEVMTNNGVIAVTAPSTGTIRIPASATILHRGIRTYTTAETDLSTTASKTYHLRWNPTDGFALKDLADTGYNSTVAAETNAAFDSSYDDMLVARIVTNSSNVVTITNLANKARLRKRELTVGPSSALTPSNWNSAFSASTALEWARTPEIVAIVGNVRTAGGSALEYANYISERSVTRYEVSSTVNSNWKESLGPTPTGLTGEIQFDILA